MSDNSPSKQQLNNCPFCGDLPRDFHWPDHYGCSNEQCGAYMANLTAEQWNRRPAHETQPVASNEWGGVEKLAQQRNDALAEVERLTRERDEALAQVIAWRHNAQALAERVASETAGNDARDAARYRVVRVSRLTGETLAHELDAACDKIVAARSAVEPECICAKKLDGQIIETHLACELHGVKAEEPFDGPTTCLGLIKEGICSCGLGDRHAGKSPEKASPAQLVDALQDPVHVEIGSTRPIQAVREGYCEHGIPRQFCTAVHDVCKDCGVELVSGTCDKCGAVNGDA